VNILITPEQSTNDDAGGMVVRHHRMVVRHHMMVIRHHMMVVRHHRMVVRHHRMVVRGARTSCVSVIYLAQVQKVCDDRALSYDLPVIVYDVDHRIPSYEH
jgi:hypothetical protein